MSNLNTAPRRVLSIYVTDFPPAPPSLDAAFRQPVAIPDSEAQEKKPLVLQRSSSSTRSMWGMRLPSRNAQLRSRCSLTEHDASLSRSDFGFGDHVKFNETIYYDTTSAGQMMHQRLAYSLPPSRRQSTPSRSSSSALASPHSTSASLAIPSLVSRLNTPSARFVQIFFREERLPIAVGWKKPKALIARVTLVPIENAIRKASEWTGIQ
ncbi:hypothetical protein C8J57DRAFT_1531925 [Mycena rebaudengoi]|nr:hypothetical protein C8J57DRAFT_1531925 [Mycena rebaudengoi]